MKSGQLMSHYKRKIFIKKFHKDYDMKTSWPGLFVFAKNYTQPLLEHGDIIVLYLQFSIISPLLEKETFEASYSY